MARTVWSTFGGKEQKFLLVSADRASPFTLDLLWLIEFFVFVISYYGELRVLIRALHQQYRWSACALCILFIAAPGVCPKLREWRVVLCHLWSVCRSDHGKFFYVFWLRFIELLSDNLGNFQWHNLLSYFLIILGIFSDIIYWVTFW